MIGMPIIYCMYSNRYSPKASTNLRIHYAHVVSFPLSLWQHQHQKGIGELPLHFRLSHLYFTFPRTLKEMQRKEMNVLHFFTAVRATFFKSDVH